jgi:hypothetical protein
VKWPSTLQLCLTAFFIGDPKSSRFKAAYFPLIRDISLSLRLVADRLSSRIVKRRSAPRLTVTQRIPFRKHIK